jgi:hypothetical protein
MDGGVRKNNFCLAFLGVNVSQRHNEVNKRLGKPEFTCTLDSIRDRYEQTDGCPLE